MMNDLTTAFLVVWVIGSAFLALVWWATKRIRQPLLRQLPRAVIIALAYTPMLVVGPSYSHGASIPAPAALVLIDALVGGDGSTARSHEQFVAWRLLFTAFAIVYLVAIGISHISKREGDVG
jgi:hypothetical protein